MVAYHQHQAGMVVGEWSLMRVGTLPRPPHPAPIIDRPAALPDAETAVGADPARAATIDRAHRRPLFIDRAIDFRAV